MLFDDLERRRAEIERHQENSARLAQEYAEFTTVGQGSIEFPDRVAFDVVFIERPFIAYGSLIDIEELQDLTGAGTQETPPLPSVSGFVTEWDVDERGFFTGCWVAASVHFVPGEVQPDLQPTVRHHFMFTAVAMKDIPIDVRD